MRAISWLLSTLLTLSLIAVVGGLLVAWQFDRQGPHRQETAFVVERGATATRVAGQLESNGLIADRRIFSLGARLRPGSIKAGEYAIPAHASMREVLDLLIEGRALLHKITIAEGLSTHAAVELVRAAPFLSGEIGTVPAEGAIKPDTYLFERNEPRDAALARMVDAQSETLTTLWQQRAPDLPIASPDEALVLASIVERETGCPAERAQVASVFVNRLRKGMRLEADASVRYGITKGEHKLGRGLRRSELDTPTPYNTYKIDGLPPTPIANPGEAALAATLNPDQTDYLFFVADGTGCHVFARTLQEHNKNVAVWREIEKQRRTTN